MSVTLVSAYDSQWPKWFEQLRSYLATLLSDIPCAIEHVGSTAVPGMAAKPVIDIDVIVERRFVPLVVIERLAAGGYRHQGDLGIVDREAFARTDEPSSRALPPHHLYVCVAGAAALADHLCFRDFLCQSPDWVERLSQLKVGLCEQSGNDRQSYITGKAAMVREITALARAPRK